jgi:hypothetical protein
VLTRVEVYSARPDAPELPLGGFMPNDDPVQIRNIEGLGPVKADLNTTAFATSRGELYQGGRTGKRNIVLTLGLNPNFAAAQDMASLRAILYQYLLPELWVKLRFYSNTNVEVDAEGYVESFEPNIFSDDPEIQVSIICPDPDFVESNASIATGVVDDGTATFEFDYPGSVPTGIELKIESAPANVSYTGDLLITLTSQDVPQEFRVDPVTIDALQYFKLSTVRGKKRAQTIAVADGTPTNLLPYVGTDSVWPVIKPGANVLQVQAGETGQAWSLAYFNRYGGL